MLLLAFTLIALAMMFAVPAATTTAININAFAVGVSPDSGASLSTKDSGVKEKQPKQQQHHQDLTSPGPISAHKRVKCPDGYVYDGVVCYKGPVKNPICPAGFTRVGDRCVKTQPDGSRHLEPSRNGKDNPCHFPPGVAGTCVVAVQPPKPGDPPIHNKVAD